MSDETRYSSSSNIAATQTSQTSSGQTLASTNGPTSPQSFGSFDENPRPELSPEPFDKRPLIAGAVVGVLFFLAAILIGIWLFNNPDSAEVLRDILIIYIGLGVFVLIPLLIVLVVAVTYLVLKLNDLTQLLTREVMPILTNVQSSVNTVRGTTTFLSDHAVKPVVTTASNVAAIQAMVRSLFRR